MRHAKAARPGGVADHDRPLSDRGRVDAALIGRALAGLDPPPHAVVSSPALRAMQTAEMVIAAAGWRVAVDVADDLYGGGVSDVLRASRDRGDVALVVGHEPTWSATVAALTGASARMVTAAVAAVEIPSGAASTDRGALLWMLIPRLVGGGPE